MKIKANVGYSESTNTIFSRDFEIEQSLPEEGDKHDGLVVTGIYPVRLDAEQPNNDVYDYDFYEIAQRQEDEDEPDPAYSEWIAVERPALEEKVTVKIYENNAGGITAIVRDGDCITNIVGCELWEDTPEEIRAALREGLPYCRDYDPDDYSGATMAEVAEEIESGDDWIATATPEGVELYPESMGNAGRKMFGVDY